MRAELQTVLASLDGIARDQLPQLMSELELVRATAMLKLSAPPPAVNEDHFLTADEVAKELGVSRKTVYRRAGRYSFTRRDGGTLRFSSLGLAKYMAKTR